MMRLKAQNAIRKEDYESILKNLSLFSSYKEIIDIHRSLQGRICDDIRDCGVDFVYRILRHGYRKSQFILYPKAIVDFIYSKYLSDYFKKSILSLMPKENLSLELSDILNSDKKINDMNEPEIKKLYFAIENYANSPNRVAVWNIAWNIDELFFNLNGKGVTTFVKNHVLKDELVKRLLETAGIHNQYKEVSVQSLIILFEELLKLDQNYAIKFIDLVLQMRFFIGSSFISAFKNFVNNDFTIFHHGFAEWVENNKTTGDGENNYHISSDEDFLNETSSLEIKRELLSYIGDFLEKNGDKISYNDFDSLSAHGSMQKSL